MSLKHLKPSSCDVKIPIRRIICFFPVFRISNIILNSFLRFWRCRSIIVDRIQARLGNR